MDIPTLRNLVALGAAALTIFFSSAASARPTSIRELAAQEVRLATISYRIAATNSHACETKEVITGLVLHDLTRYDVNVRPAVAQAFSVVTGFGVLGIVSGSVAAHAGLRAGDEIIAVGEFSLEDAQAYVRPKSYRRMEQFHAIVDRTLNTGETKLLVRRDGRLLRLAMQAQHGCGGKLALTSSSTMNAWADGKHVVVTTGMTGLSRSDDEIAFVIAHEMAHNMLRHSIADGRSRGFFGFSRIRRGEIEADAYAVRLMKVAGYQAAGGVSFLQNARRRFWWSFSLDHPSFGRRIKTVSAAIRENERT